MLFIVEEKHEKSFVKICPDTLTILSTTFYSNLRGKPYYAGIINNECFFTFDKGIDKLGNQHTLNLFKWDPDTSTYKIHSRIQPFVHLHDLPDRVLMTLWQAVIDDNRELIIRILDARPELLLIDPPEDFVIESQLTWQKIFAENPLTMAAKRKQIKMIELLLSYYDKLPQTESVMEEKEKSLSCWTPYQTFKDQDEDEILIPEEYADYALALINVFSQETFPNGIPDGDTIPITVKFSEETEEALDKLFNKLLPEHAVKLDDCFDMELLLLAFYKSYAVNFNLFQNWEQRDAFCVRVIGLIQGVQSPEMAKILCEGLDGVVAAQQKGQEKEISEKAQGHKLKDGSAFYRACREVFAGMGFNFLCGIYGGWARRRGGGDGGGADVLEKSCRAKAATLECYAASAATATRTPFRS